MQTNIEQDKREEIEVELPEEEKVETQPQQETVEEQPQQEEVKVEETQDSQDEVENYSAKVKSRIDKLTKRLREAERREEAAYAYAKGVQQEKEKIQGAYQKLDKNYIDQERMTYAQPRGIYTNLLVFSSYPLLKFLLSLFSNPNGYARERTCMQRGSQSDRQACRQKA